MTSLFRIAAAASLGLSLSVAPAFAQTAPSPQLQAARDVIDASGAAASMSGIVPIFLDEAKRTFVRTQPDLAKDFDAVVKIIQPEFEKRREDLLNQIASVYAERFTAQELAEIKAFYKGATGAKLVAILPGVLESSYEKTNVWSRQMSQDVITRMREEMKKKGHNI